MEAVELNGLFINSKYKDTFVKSGLVDFYSIYNFQSDKYFTKNPSRDVISFSLDECTFFLKRHRERYWILPGGSSPAEREWKNIDVLNKSGFRTNEPVVYGQKIPQKGRRLSFIITKKIEGAVSLEKYILSAFKNEGYNSRQKIIKTLAEFAKRFHSMGFCHQDFYAGHIFLGEGRLYLIDVQRLLKKKMLRDRWRLKDIAQLNYSVPKDIIGNTERIRFLKFYFGVSKLDRKVKLFIKKLQRKTEKISRHTQKLIARGRFNY